MLLRFKWRWWHGLEQQKQKGNINQRWHLKWLLIYRRGEFGTGLLCILAQQIWVHLARRCSYIHHQFQLQAKVRTHCINLFSRGYSTQGHVCNCRHGNRIFFSSASSFLLSCEIYIQLLLFPSFSFHCNFFLSLKHWVNLILFPRTHAPRIIDF